MQRLGLGQALRHRRFGNRVAGIFGQVALLSKSVESNDYLWLQAQAQRQCLNRCLVVPGLLVNVR